MSQRTYCDRCGAETKFRTGHLHLTENHMRASGEHVSMDEYKPYDLCGTCIDELRAWAGDLLVIVSHYDHDGGHAVMAAPVPQPFYNQDQVSDGPPPVPPPHG